MTSNVNRTPEQRECEKCGASVTNAGRRSADGLYYCKQAVCQAAKSKRRYREAAQFDQRPWAPEICANPQCARKLKPRRMRIGDTPLGRWCDNPVCRRDRMARLKQGTVPGADELVEQLELAKKSLAFLRTAALEPRVECPDCQCDDVVKGYRHPDGYGDPCTGTWDGQGWLSPHDAYAVWPDRTAPPPDMVVELPTEA